MIQSIPEITGFDPSKIKIHQYFSMSCKFMDGHYLRGLSLLGRLPRSPHHLHHPARVDEYPKNPMKPAQMPTFRIAAWPQPPLTQTGNLLQGVASLILDR